MEWIDPAGELTWFRDELFKAEKANETVHVLIHCPTEGNLPGWAKAYIKLVERFENTVTNMFLGHTHHFAYKVFYDMENAARPISSGFVGPSVMTDGHPAYTIYELDGPHDEATWVIIKIRTNTK